MKTNSDTIFNDINDFASSYGVFVYCIGGFVRDMILCDFGYSEDQVFKDIDIALSGNTYDVLDDVKNKYNEDILDIKEYRSFKTATIIFKDDTSGIPRRLDLSTFRKEKYTLNGKLPKVYPGTFEDDIKRRDFTINSVAFSLNKATKGEFVDLAGGIEDIRNKTIKVLHDKSFLNDPTRIYRAVKYSHRLGFEIDEYTKKLINEAVYSGVVALLSEKRIYNEMRLIEKEKESEKIIAELNVLGV